MGASTDRTASAVQQAAGMMAIGLGLSAVAGWLADVPVLHTWRTGTVPMAPLTALLFVSLGGQLVVLARASGRQTDRAVIAVATGGGLLAAGVLVLRLLGAFPQVERLGLADSGPGMDPLVGFVSPLTAAWFMVAATSLVSATWSGSAGSKAGARLAAVLGGLTVAGGALLLAISLFGAPLLLGNQVIPAATATSAGMIVAGLGLVALATRQYRQAGAPATDAPGLTWFAVAFVVVAALSLGVGYAYYRALERGLRADIEAELETVADLKTSQVAQWRLERMGDAAIMLHGAATVLPVNALLAKPDDPEVRAAVAAWFDSYESYRQYDRLFVFDRTGRVALSHPVADTPPGPYLAARVVDVLGLGQPQLADFHRREPDGRATLALIVPIIPEHTATPVGAIALGIDPSRFLYPFLDRWPSSSRSGESLLVERDGDDALVLNSVRVGSHGPLELRIPLDGMTTLATGAVLGLRGTVEGLDYTGRRALAVVREVPDSPWVLVSRIDESELQSALWRELQTVASFTGLLLVAVGSGLGLTWRNQRERFFEAQARMTSALQATSAKLGRLLVNSPTVIYTLRRVGDQLVADDVSDNVERILGYTPDEALAPGWWFGHLHPEDRDAAVARMAVLTAVDAFEHEYRFRRKDGSELWVQDRLQVVAREQGTPVVVAGSWSDVTERRAAEASVRDSEQRLRLALAAASQGLWDLDLRTGNAVVSPEYATMLGYDPATFHESHAGWLARMHPDDRGRCQALFREYLEGRTGRYHMEFRQRTHEGGWRWIMSQAQVVDRSADGRPLRMLGTHIDITDRKEAELRTARLSQLYAAMSACNEAIVRCRDEAELFQRVCEAAVDHGCMAMAWVGIVDPATSQVTAVAAHGEGTEYLDGIDISVDAARPQGRGPTGIAIRENRPCFVMDFTTDPATAPWHARAARFGWATSAGLPLTRGGRPVGALTIYSRSVEMFDEAGRKLLREMAADISFALDALDRDRQRLASERALQQSLHEKEALLKEVHHRVKNNLQVINSLLRLEVGRSDQPAVKAALGEMQSRVLSMALLHETLYRSDNLAQVDLATYLRQLAQQVFRSVGPASRQVSLDLQLAPARLDLDQAIPCGLLVNELLSNSLKHGFPDGRSGRVQVVLAPVDEAGALALQVSDSGVGLPDDFDQRRARSLGLQLVSDLARQLHGTVEFAPAPGARCRVVFTPRPAGPREARLP